MRVKHNKIHVLYPQTLLLVRFINPLKVHIKWYALTIHPVLLWPRYINLSKQSTNNKSHTTHKPICTLFEVSHDRRLDDSFNHIDTLGKPIKIIRRKKKSVNKKASSWLWHSLINLDNGHVITSHRAFA